ncbi:MAG: pur operon repressor [Firmicutes bacterium]|nr:pur operon repressor [Bacillota bacterium]
MARAHRGERIAFIVKSLIERPSAVLSLSTFADRFGAAKSTISEDLAIVRRGIEDAGAGRIVTMAGAAGGVKYVPSRPVADIRRIALSVCGMLSSPDRILPGGFLYMTDLINSPVLAWEIGEVFATKFAGEGIDYVVTMETRGIPIALMTARAMDLPLVVCRRDSGVTEGSSVGINYVSGSTRSIQTMSLPKRALQPGSKALVIDDFMKAGGTAKGIADLLGEFDVTVAGTCVVVATSEPGKKLVDEFLALAVLEAVDETERRVKIGPAGWVPEEGR